MDLEEAKKLILGGTEACRLLTALGSPDREQVLSSLELVCVLWDVMPYRQ